ncbi:hypothetical protein [Luteibacter yeojuensis]
MKWKRMLALLGWSMGALTTSPVSLAEQRLTAKLETPYASDSKRSAIVKLTLHNIGDEPVAIMKWDTPFVMSGGRLPKSQYEVKNGVGEVSRYIGRSVNIGRILSSYFIVLQSGESIEKEVDLTYEYDYGAGGAFSVKFTLSLDRAPDRYVVTDKEFRDFKRNTLKYVESNETTIYIPEPVKPISLYDGDDCDEPKKEVIFSAWSKAFDPIWDAGTFMM